jgi:hypothetical protein
VSNHETPAETQPLQFDRVITESDSSDAREKVALLFDRFTRSMGLRPMEYLFVAA